MIFLFSVDSVPFRYDSGIDLLFYIEIGYNKIQALKLKLYDQEEISK